METLRNLVTRKKYNCPWVNVCASWETFVFRCSNLSLNRQTNPWNSWKEWTEAWANFELSGKKPPRSGKHKAAMWRQLNCIAKYTLQVFETMGQNEKVLLGKLQEMTKSFQEQIKMLLEHQALVDKQHQDELKTKSEKEEKWRSKAAEYEARCKDANKEIIELQAALEKSQQLCAKEEQENSLLIDTIKRLCNELDPQDGIVAIPNRNIVQRATKQSPWIEEIESTSLLKVINIANVMGPITDKNVMEWLHQWQQGVIVKNWTDKDLARVLYQCMNSDAFSLLPENVKKGSAPWLVACKYIVTCVIPNSIKNKTFTSEPMTPNESVMKYFNRVWMEYQIYCQTDMVTRSDKMYKSMICAGLDRQLLVKVGYRISQEWDYEIIRQVACSAEPGWRFAIEEQTKSNSYQQSKKAGAGFLSRGNIWWRLSKYEDPRVNLNGAPLCRLVARLSKFEDLETGQPRRQLHH